MLPPLPLDRLWIEETISSHRSGVEQVLRPALQRTSQPKCDRRFEALFFALEQRARHVAGQHLLEEDLCPCSDALAGARQFERKFDHAMIKDRAAPLQAYRHSGPIKLGQDVVRQISQ